MAVVLVIIETQQRAIMEIIKPVRIIFNMRSFLFRKTGIGYYAHNILEGLLKSKEVVVYPTIDEQSTKALRFMSGVSRSVRAVLGDSILKISVPLGDFLISKREKANKIPEAQIYHETNYDEIPAGNWKRVANIYDLAFIKYPEHLPKEVVLKCKAGLKHISEADRFIVNTLAIKQELMDSLTIPGEKIEVIPLAPSGKYFPVNKDVMEGRSYVDQYTTGPYILYVGTIEPRKNLQVLLKAFRIIRDRFDIKLVLAGGKGWMYDDILKIPRDLGMKNDVIFTGYVDEKTMLYLYNFASVFVYPSVYEGFGIPVVEAMACGIPVVISGIPSLSEVAGAAAVSFNPEDYEELAHEIGQIITSGSLAKELSTLSLQRAGEFSWEKAVTSTIKTYYKALED